MGGANYLWKVTLTEGGENERRYDVGEYSWPLGGFPKHPIPYSPVGENLTHAQMLVKIYDGRTHLGDLVAEHCRQPGEHVEVHYEWYFAP